MISIEQSPSFQDRLKMFGGGRPSGGTTNEPRMATPSSPKSWNAQEIIQPIRGGVKSSRKDQDSREAHEEYVRSQMETKTNENMQQEEVEEEKSDKQMEQVLMQPTQNLVSVVVSPISVSSSVHNLGTENHHRVVSPELSSGNTHESNSWTVKEEKRNSSPPHVPTEYAQSQQPVLKPRPPQRSAASNNDHSVMDHHQRVMPDDSEADEEKDGALFFSPVRARTTAPRSRPLKAEFLEEEYEEITSSNKRRIPGTPVRPGSLQASSRNKRAVSLEPPSQRRVQTANISPAATIVKVLKSGRTTPEQQTMALERLPISPIRETKDVVESRIPDTHVSVIQNVFGIDCDLYRDVLLVDSKHASDRQIRVAYFRRGREVLANAKDDDNRFSGLTLGAKAKFHAISLAYDIASCPSWRASYDKHGWNQSHVPLGTGNEKETRLEAVEDEVPDPELDCDDISVNSTPAAVPVTSILRPGVRSKGLKRNKSVGARGIRWSEEVEELIYRCDPDESSGKNDAARASRQSRKDFKEEALAHFKELEKLDLVQSDSLAGKKKKKKVIVDVTRKMKDMEKRAFQNSFMDMFLSDIDTSLDGLEASLEGMMSGSNRKVAVDTSDLIRDEETRVSNTSIDAVKDSMEAASDDENDAADSFYGHGNENEQAGATTQTDGPRQDETSTADVFNLNDTLENVLGPSEEMNDVPQNKGGSADRRRRLRKQKKENSIDDQAAQELFSTLTKPVPTLTEEEIAPIAEEEIKMLRRQNPEPLSNPEKQDIRGDEWDPNTHAAPTVKPRARSPEFDEAFDPFADSSFIQDKSVGEQEESLEKSLKVNYALSTATSIRELKTEDSERLKSGYPAVIKRSTGSTYTEISGVTMPDTQSTVAETNPADTSFDTGILEQTCTACKAVPQLPICRDGDSQSVRSVSVSEGASFAHKQVDGRTKLKPKRKMARSKASAEAEQNFFSDLVTYMGRVSKDLTVIGSQMSEGANQVVVNTQQMLAETFVLPEDKVDDVLKAMGMAAAEVENPAVERSFTY